MAGAPARVRTAVVDDPAAETKDDLADSQSPANVAGEPTRGGAPLDESRLHSGYANFCSVRRTVEELVLDFGLTTEFMGPSKHPVVLEQRVVMSYFTAKRLMEALRVSMQQHEAVFGAVELDPRKRAKQGNAGRAAVVRADADEPVEA